jgi:hypothetical protein
MKCSIVSTSSLALIISLTLIATSNNYNIAFAQESYLKLKSADVDYHNGDLDVDMQTEKNIPSEKGKRGFGYGVLTDVGDEFVDNVLVAISDIGIQDYDRSAKNDKLHTYMFDLTGDISRACSGSDYEVAKSSSDNDAFDTVYPIDVKENKISISDVDVDDLASDTVKAITSFSAEAITHNDKIQHVCIDIQDTLKQSEISISYDTSNSNNNGNDNDDNDNNNRKEHDDDTKNDDNDDLFDIDIDQDIDVSNGCNNEVNCDSEVNNEADIADDIDIDSDNDEFGLDLGQIIDQSNDCTDSSTCSNEGNNEANFWENSDDSGGDGNEDIDIGQHIQQKNECNDEAKCNNEGSNTANVFGSTDNDGDFDSDVDIDQSIEQSSTCSGDSVCSNFANNMINVD